VNIFADSPEVQELKPIIRGICNCGTLCIMQGIKPLQLKQLVCALCSFGTCGWRKLKSDYNCLQKSLLSAVPLFYEL